MAKARALDRRRKSIRNIRKITRTMELISTARFKRAMDRASAATGYVRRMTELVAHVAQSGLEVKHPLLEPRPEPRRAILLVLTANRGLCAGYNSSVLRLAFARYEELRDVVPDVRLEVAGKRGISAFRFRKIKIDEAFTHFEDKPTFAEVDVLASRYLADFTAGEENATGGATTGRGFMLDRLDVAYTRYESASRQQAVLETLLPLGGLAGAGQVGNLPPQDEEMPAVGPQYEFLPSAASILEEVVPMSFKVRLFKCFLDAGVSEQIARMTAMKAATENADQMISQLSMAYNRARQGQITSELLEIIGGAEALNE